MESKRENWTDTAQEAPGARFVPTQVSPVFFVKAHMRPAPVTLSAVIATLDALTALFVTVTVPEPVRVPAGRVMLGGVIVKVPLVATPVPVSVTGEPVTVAAVPASA